MKPKVSRKKKRVSSAKEQSQKEQEVEVDDEEASVEPEVPVAVEPAAVEPAAVVPPVLLVESASSVAGGGSRYTALRRSRSMRETMTRTSCWRSASSRPAVL